MTIYTKNSGQSLEYHSVQITTDNITGEYEIDLLPIVYEIKFSFGNKLLTPHVPNSGEFQDKSC